VLGGPFDPKCNIVLLSTLSCPPKDLSLFDALQFTTSCEVYENRCEPSTLRCAGQNFNLIAKHGHWGSQDYREAGKGGGRVEGRKGNRRRLAEGARPRKDGACLYWWLMRSVVFTWLIKPAPRGDCQAIESIQSPLGLYPQHVATDDQEHQGGQAITDMGL
jgi:hypothetical protein